MQPRSESTPLLANGGQAPSVLSQLICCPCNFVCAVLRRLFFIIFLVLIIIVLIIALILCCICAPCIKYCLQGCFDCETLDGADAKPDAATEKEVLEARASAPLHAEIEYFAQLGENLQRNLTREITLQIDDPEVDVDVPAKRERLLQKLASQRYRPLVLTIQIDRDHIVQQTLQCLCSVPPNRLLARSLLMISFNGAEAIAVDFGGVARDWFDTLGHKLVEEAEGEKGCLMVLEDKTLFPRPYEQRHMDLLAIGRLAGLAVFYNHALPIPLGSVVCKFLLGESINPKDVKRLDPDFYQFRVKPVLAPGGVDILETALCEPLMFMSAPTPLRESKELCPGGDKKRVTEENKLEYIKLLCENYIIGDREEQIKILLQGFWDIFPKEKLISSGVTYRELALLISGYSVIDPIQWRAHTQADVSPAYGEMIEWFWQMVQEMSEEDRAKLLHFTTGSSRLPSNGFAGLEPRFNIVIEPGEQNHVPQAHTCANQLVLPSYSSKEMLVEKMQTSLAHDEGFGFA